MKKFISVMLSVLMLTSMASLAGAAESRVVVDSVVTQSVLLDTETVSSQYKNSFYSRAGSVDIESLTEKVQNLTEELPEVTVAVIDTGIDFNNPIFENRVDTERDRDFYNDDDYAYDKFGHGTIVSSVIVDGTPDNVKILPLCAFDENGSSTVIQVAQAILYATTCNVDVINLSLGYSASEGNYLEPFIQEALDKGIVVVCSAGNVGQSDQNYNAGTHSPGNIEGVITVGAHSDDTKSVAYYSKYGDCVDVFAPGTAVCAVAGSTEFSSFTGTSISAPIVSAVAATLKSYDKSLTCQDVEMIIKHLATPMDDSEKITNGAGALNLTNAFDEAFFVVYKNEFTALKDEVIDLEYFCFPSNTVTITSADDLWEATNNDKQIKWLGVEGTHTLTLSSGDLSEDIEITTINSETCEHDWVYNIISIQTCKTVSEYNISCSKCGFVKETIKGNTYGDHVYSAWSINSPASCVKTGSKSRVCVICNNTENAEIEALGHDFVEHSAKSATCTTSGYNAYQTCSRCDYSNYQEIAPKGHNIILTKEAKPATCTSAGYTAEYGCSDCSYIETSSTILPATGHIDSNSDNKCDNCGKSLSSESSDSGSSTNFIQTLLNFFKMIGDFFKKLFK